MVVYLKFRRRKFNMTNQSELLTANDTAIYLKVTPQYVRKLIKENLLKAERLGSQWLVKKEDLYQYISDNDVLIEPDDHERRSNDLPNIVALSFFSGALGLDIGMRNKGIKPLLVCEFNKYCRMTIEKNDPDTALIGDINKYSAEDILKLAKIPEDRKVDIIFGGPPCQAFSTAGARRGFDDERGNVFLRYLDIVDKIKPTYVVIENVRGLLSAEYPCELSEKPIKGGALYIILERLKKSGYTVSFELYNAANLGAPQIRERVVIIGKLGKEKVSYLRPTNSSEPQFKLPPWHTLGEALSKLEASSPTHHYITFPEKRLRFYRLLKEGQYWKDLPIELHREAMGNKLELGGGKTGFLRRLSFSRPSPTLVTNPTMPATDLCHPVENRPLSVEEYCSIQEFPQDWQICGPILEQYRQIGNAVPIKLGEAIALTILNDMNNIKNETISGFPYSRYKNTNDKTWRIAFNKAIKRQNDSEKELPVQLSLNLN